MQGTVSLVMITKVFYENSVQLVISVNMSSFYTEEAGNRFLLNTDYHLPDYLMSYLPKTTI